MKHKKKREQVLTFFDILELGDSSGKAPMEVENEPCGPIRRSGRTRLCVKGECVACDSDLPVNPFRRLKLSRPKLGFGIQGMDDYFFCCDSFCHNQFSASAQRYPKGQAIVDNVWRSIAGILGTKIRTGEEAFITENDYSGRKRIDEGEVQVLGFRVPQEPGGNVLVKCQYLVGKSVVEVEPDVLQPSGRSKDRILEEEKQAMLPPRRSSRNQSTESAQQASPFPAVTQLNSQQQFEDLEVEYSAHLQQQQNAAEIARAQATKQEILQKAAAQYERQVRAIEIELSREARAGMREYKRELDHSAEKLARIEKQAAKYKEQRDSARKQKRDAKEDAHNLK